MNKAELCQSQIDQEKEIVEAQEYVQAMPCNTCWSSSFLTKTTDARKEPQRLRGMWEWMLLSWCKEKKGVNGLNQEKGTV